MHTLTITSREELIGDQRFTCLTLEGLADISSDTKVTEAFDALVSPEAVNSVALFGAKLEYIDSRFISRLVGLANTLSGKGASLVLVAFHKSTLDTLETVGVTNIIPHVASIEGVPAVLA